MLRGAPKAAHAPVAKVQMSRLAVPDNTTTNNQIGVASISLGNFKPTHQLVLL